MKTRILDPTEWNRIPGPLSEALPLVDPHNVVVVAVEESGEIVATVSVIRISHFEGLWIHPDHRGNAGVFRALIRQAYGIPKVRGEQWVLANAKDGDATMESICKRLCGETLPYRFCILPVGE